MEPGEVIVAMFAFSAAAFSVRAIANAVVRYQEVKARHNGDGISRATEARLERIEQAVDSIALEIERISEGQRFTTKLLNERTGAPH
jgi:parvulin-like peptidyl-prolyl isomerase